MKPNNRKTVLVDWLRCLSPIALPIYSMYMSNQDRLSRRKFIQTSSLAAATVPTLSARSYANVSGANDRLKVGIIGCGSIGGAHLKALLQVRKDQNLEVSAVCDIFERRARAFDDHLSKMGERVRVHTDYRRLLETPDLDYVVVSTPEHWHAPIAIDALDAGLDVYCEKPLAHKLAEAQEIWAKVRETGRNLQVGVQGTSDDSYESAARAIRGGKLGPVVQAQVDYVRNYARDLGPWRTGVRPDLPQPSDLDWETWLGTRQKRPWDPGRYFEWRCYRDYSGGISTDLFVHRLTRILKACSLTYPSRVSGMGGIYIWDDGRELPDNMEVLLEYPAVEGVTNGMTVHLLGTMANGNGNKHIIRGKEASLVFNSKGWEIVSEETSEVLQTHTRSGAEEIALHHVNLQDAIRRGEELHCPVQLGVYGVAALDGANQSWLSRRMLSWDDSAQKWV